MDHRHAQMLTHAADGSLSSEVQMTILELVHTYWVGGTPACCSAFWMLLAPADGDASFFYCSAMPTAPWKGGTVAAGMHMLQSLVPSSSPSVKSTGT